VRKRNAQKQASPAQTPDVPALDRAALLAVRPQEPSEETAAMKIRDRIKELRRVPARNLLANPKNWRSHPQAQQDALKGLLAELGYCDALLARELPDGQLQLIDGHLRCDTTPDMEVPVLVLDVTEAEADKLLVTLDPWRVWPKRIGKPSPYSWLPS